MTFSKVVEVMNESERKKCYGFVLITFLLLLLPIQIDCLINH